MVLCYTSQRPDMLYCQYASPNGKGQEKSPALLSGAGFILAQPRAGGTQASSHLQRSSAKSRLIPPMASPVKCEGISYAKAQPHHNDIKGLGKFQN